MQFSIAYSSAGFVDGKSNTDIVYNGTFFNNSYLPHLGYDKNFDLTDEDLRQKYGLSQKERLPEVADPMHPPQTCSAAMPITYVLKHRSVPSRIRSPLRRDTCNVSGPKTGGGTSRIKWISRWRISSRSYPVGTK